MNKERIPLSYRLGGTLLLLLCWSAITTTAFQIASNNGGSGSRSRSRSASVSVPSSFQSSLLPTASSVRRVSSVACFAEKKRFQHAMAILAMPYTSIDRIANEAILETVLPTTNKLSVVLKCEGSKTPSVASLRRYVGEVYSQLWDCAMNTGNNNNKEGDDNNIPMDADDLLPDVVVYPAHLPNAAPEGWIAIQKDLDCVCSHDSYIGWHSEAATGRGIDFQTQAGQGRGGLRDHVAALNRERQQRNLAPVQVLTVPEQKWPAAAIADRNVLFLDDDEGDECLLNDDNTFNSAVTNSAATASTTTAIAANSNNGSNSLLVGGTPTVPPKQLFQYVAVGGTFDGLHFGHRKLLTLAVSSVNPWSGRLLVGVTADEMLSQKSFAKYIPTIQQRSAVVESFLHRLAPGMMNRIKIVPIVDKFGPPGSDARFDALVLSHETLETGQEMNKHRISHDMAPVALLCTRRTEAHGMCSTTLRRMRYQKDKDQIANTKNAARAAKETVI